MKLTSNTPSPPTDVLNFELIIQNLRAYARIGFEESLVCADMKTDVYFRSHFPAKLPSGCGDDTDEMRAELQIFWICLWGCCCKWRGPLPPVIPPSLPSSFLSALPPSQQRFSEQNRGPTPGLWAGSRDTNEL